MGFECCYTYEWIVHWGLGRELYWADTVEHGANGMGLGWEELSIWVGINWRFAQCLYNT